jgi:2-oxoglutarate ferredoxin oxidoreductase subunit alpha
LTGIHFMLGDQAIAEGALAAGCRFFGGYPITPSTEVAERMAERLPEVGGLYIQMEDELASMAAILGAAWGGLKAMTATSGPGFSLMLENIGLGIITETPCVVVNVQRAGPSTGLPTQVGQGDMQQVRWGSHGPYEVIALVPASAQECFDLTVRAFNLAERYRTPVFILADAEVGHMTEKVVIPPAEEIGKRLQVGKLKVAGCLNLRPATLRAEPQGEACNLQLVPPMPPVGAGHKVFVESLTHDEQGYPVMSAEAQARLVRRLVDKIRLNADDILDWEERFADDAEVVVVSYGISARVAGRAVRRAREKGIRAGLFRLITAWPFPEARIRELARRVKGFVVPEINLGQMSREVERCAGNTPAVLVPHAGGDIHEPRDILAAIEQLGIRS